MENNPCFLRAPEQTYSSYCGRVIMALNLRSIGQHCSCVRTPVVAKLLLSILDIGENVVASEHQLPENRNANSFNRKKTMPRQMKKGKSTIEKEKRNVQKKVEVTVEAAHIQKRKVKQLGCSAIS